MFFFKNMGRKFSLRAVPIIVAGLLTLTSTQSYALRLDCDADFKEMQDNFGRSMMVRDQAMARQIIKRSDSALAIVCFDMAMGRSSRAGQIFSDVLPGGFPGQPTPWDAAIATGLGDYGPPNGNTGGTSTLLQQIGLTVNPEYVAILNDFAGSYATTLGYTTSQITGILLAANLYTNATTASVQAETAVAAPAFNCNRMQTIWDDEIIGEGLTPDAPYSSIDELFAAAIPGAGTEMAQEIANDAAILGDSQSDATDLDTPGNYSSFKIIPVFTATATVVDVIADM